MNQLIQSGSCCNPCSDPQVENLPGLPGTDGTDGTNGENAWALLTAGAVMPAIGADVTVSVTNNQWAPAGLPVFIESIGHFEVVSQGGSTSLTLTNLGSLGNVSPGTAIPLGSTITPAGISGVAGLAKGSAVIANGATSVAVAGLGLSSTITGVVCSIRVPSGGMIIFACVDTSTLTNDGFTANFSAATPAVGYSLDFIAFF